MNDVDEPKLSDDELDGPLQDGLADADEGEGGNLEQARIIDADAIGDELRGGAGDTDDAERATGG